MRKTRFRIRALDGMVVLAIVALIAWKGMSHSARTPLRPDPFVQQVNLEPLENTAVWADGRLRSFGSHAKTYMGYVSGPRKIHGQSNGVTYLDLMFRPEQYTDEDIIYVKNKLVRNRILGVLQDHAGVDSARLAAIRKSGLISPAWLSEPAVVSLLQRLGQDLIKTSKSVDAIQSALAVASGDFLQEKLSVVAPPGGKANDPWLSITQLISTRDPPQDAVHGAMVRPISGLDSAFQEKVAQAWTSLGKAWRNRDAAAVNTQIATLTGLFPTVSSQLYPSRDRLGMESWYFRHQSMTWVWLLYLAGVVPLLMSVIYKWDRARAIGMVLFVVAFLAHTASVGVRWYISGRWPNSNMFEAVTTSAWFGGVAALVLERIARRSPFRNLFALGSSVISMAALMAAYFLPARLDSSISNKMAALNDVWLYIHTNVIIWSYAVIALACVPALLYLRQRWCNLWDQGVVPKVRLLIVPIAAVVLNYTAYRLLMHVLTDPSRALSDTALIGAVGAFCGSAIVILLELEAARARRRAGAAVERAAAGGAASFIRSAAGGPSFLRGSAPSASQVYDGATMVLVELSFVMLWTGVVMGAIWADHSWGRPWGWDPKEVFALNTFIIFLVLIHVRLKVRDKGFWTAVLAVVGFEVMMFNWIAVNFIITGLHSYA